MYGGDQKSPLSRYPGPDDPRYMKLKAKVRTFMQDFLFFRAVRNASKSILTNILEQGGLDPDIPRSRGKTALHIAAEQGHCDIVRTLILWGADMSVKTADGKTALQIAVEKPNQGMVDLLLKKGARPDASYNNGTPLWELSTLAPRKDDSDPVRKAICSLLKDPPLMDGPSKEGHARQQRGGSQDWLPPPPRPPYGETACKEFDVTIANFFSTGANQEIFDIRTTSIHDILYYTAPSEIYKRILAKAEKTPTGLGETRFSWYHVPANNVSNVYTILYKSNI